MPSQSYHELQENGAGFKLLMPGRTGRLVLFFEKPFALTRVYQSIVDGTMQPIFVQDGGQHLPAYRRCDFGSLIDVPVYYQRGAGLAEMFVTEIW